jgi:hypothetical protein
MYNVNVYNNTLAYTVAGVPTTLVLPPGNYNIATFIIAFNGAQSSIVIADVATTNKFAFTSASITQILMAGGSTMSRLLGLTSDTIAGTAYGGDVIYSMIYTYKLHLVSDTLARNDNAITSNRKKYPIICSVALDVGFAYIKHHEEDRMTADYCILNGSSNLSTINLKMVDDDFRTIDLNGSEWIVEMRVQAH